MRTTLLALVLAMSACSPPPEVEEISAAQDLTVGFSVSQYVYVGYSPLNNSTMVVSVSLGSGQCDVFGLSQGGNGSPLQEWTIHSQGGNDSIMHVPASGIAVNCANGGGGTYFWGTLYPPHQANGFRINLDGGAGDDSIECDGTDTYVGNGLGNVCYGGTGNDKIYVRRNGVAVQGGDGNDKILVTAPAPNKTIVQGDAGNDCVDWGGSVQGPAAYDSAGDDSIRSITGAKVAQGFEHSVGQGHCGF